MSAMFGPARRLSDVGLCYIGGELVAFGDRS